MNTPSHAMHESPTGSQSFAPFVVSALRPFYWSVRREFWENRWFYIAPLAAAALFLIGFLLKMIVFRYRMHGLPADSTQQGHILAMPYEVSASLIMGIVGILGFFYTLDALYGERRDRSILFWKSLPVSDLTVVLSKMSIPLVLLPVLSLIITFVANFTMLLLASAVLLGSGANIAALWTQGSFFHVSLVLFYHIVTVHGLWYAPIYGWLLLVSAAVPRAPFVWALLPPFVICVVEKVTFNTWHFATMLQERLIGPSSSASTMSEGASMDPMSHLIPHHFLSEPGLWIGLAITAVFLAATVRIRRYRGPI
jgi:ABC-2 type transport system permease protein